MTDTQSWLAQASEYSLYLQRLAAAGQLDHPLWHNWLPRPLSRDDYHTFCDWQALIDADNEAELSAQLRRLRRLVMAHILTRDLNRISDLAEVTRTITEFADFAVITALTFAYEHYRALYGTPIGAQSGEPQTLSVVAMGKMGSFELNVSSDIDLIFIYGENGDTDGKRERSNAEFFTKVGQKLIALLDDCTADGQVFRVDMRLRPDGDSGPLVISERVFEQYLIQQGREWERYAWLKGRVLTPYPNQIDQLVQPFVYRKYLDFNAFEAMRGLHRQIRAQVERKGMQDNVKLGAGGIREVEFIAQIFQLIRGGRDKSLQLKGTQEALRRLGQVGLLEAAEVETLLDAYRFLRDTEHRLQYWDDRQTQTLPQTSEQQNLLAKSMGFATWEAFSHALDGHREAINRIFNAILAEPEEADAPTRPDHSWAAWWKSLTLDGDDTDSGSLKALLAERGFDADSVAARLSAVAHSSRYRQLSAQARQRFDTLVPQLLDAAERASAPTATLLRLMDFMEAVSRRSAYLALLHEYPPALARLADIMNQSSWVADYLERHPILLDELLSEELLHKDSHSSSARYQAWQAELSGSLKEARGDVEAQLDILRHFQHAQTFRLAVQDLAGLWTIEALSDELSALADLIIGAAVAEIWLTLKQRHRDDPRFAVIAYGKLGGKELGYASDLDLVYVYEDNHPEAADIYGRLAQRLTHWLSATTPAGTLYSIDLRLRPNGEAGFSVSSLAAFARYQRENAWTWEHQALTRARCVCGPEALSLEFDAIRDEILTRRRDVATLRADIIQMREKMFPTHPPQDSDVKYARGGVVDVEFIVQYLILEHSHRHPHLTLNHGNIALLSIAAQTGLIDTELAEAAAAAYREFRRIQHNKRLRDAPNAKPDAQLRARYEAVKALWTAVFGQEPRQAA